MKCADLKYNKEGRPELEKIIQSVKFDKNKYGSEEEEDMLNWMQKVPFSAFSIGIKGESQEIASVRENLKKELDNLVTYFINLKKFTKAQPEKNILDFDFIYDKSTWGLCLDCFDKIDVIRKQLDEYNKLTDHVFEKTVQMQNVHDLLRGMTYVSSELEKLSYKENNYWHKTKEAYENKKKKNDEDYQILSAKAKKNNLEVDEIHRIYCAVKPEADSEAKKIKNLKDALEKVREETKSREKNTDDLKTYEKAVLKEIELRQKKMMNYSGLIKIEQEWEKNYNERQDLRGDIALFSGLCEKAEAIYTADDSLKQQKKNEMQEFHDNMKMFSESGETEEAFGADDSLRNRVRERVNSFLNKMDVGKRKLHINSDEFTAMKKRMQEYLDGNGSMQAIRDAAETYLEAKKGGINANSDMRNYRLSLARDLKAFAEEWTDLDEIMKTEVREAKQVVCSLYGEKKGFGYETIPEAEQKAKDLEMTMQKDLTIDQGLQNVSQNARLQIIKTFNVGVEKKVNLFKESAGKLDKEIKEAQQERELAYKNCKDALKKTEINRKKTITVTGHTPVL